MKKLTKLQLETLRRLVLGYGDQPLTPVLRRLEAAGLVRLMSEWRDRRGRRHAFASVTSDGMQVLRDVLGAIPATWGLQLRSICPACGTLQNQDLPRESATLPESVTCLRCGLAYRLAVAK